MPLNYLKDINPKPFVISGCSVWIFYCPDVGKNYWDGETKINKFKEKISETSNVLVETVNLTELYEN